MRSDEGVSKDVMEALNRLSVGTQDTKNQLAELSASIIPTLMQEYANDQGGGTQQIQTYPKTSNYFRVRGVAIGLPATATGVLQLGELVLPLQSFTSNFSPVLSIEIVLGPEAPRVLSSSVASSSGNPLVLFLWGDILSRRSLLR